MRFLLPWLCAAAFAPAYAHAQACESWGTQGKRLHADDFGATLAQWLPEYSRAGESAVGVADGKLLIDVGGGATVWFRNRLQGNLLISFTRKVVMRGGKHDRLSDLNMFWMASDPANPDLFTRSGEFSEYDGLALYYAGIGGNTNTTTRFRRYGGNGERVLHGELTDAASMLAPNKTYAIQIAVYRGCTRVLVDGKEFFQYRDPKPLTTGYFGFRTTQSRQEIDDFTIHQLD